MADFTPPPPIQSQPQSQQQPTQNQTRNRRRRTPRPPREGPQASVESLGHGSDGHATVDNTHSSSSIATPAFGTAGSSRPNQSNRNSGNPSRRDRTNASSGDSRRDRESTSSSNRGNRRGGRYGQTIRHPRTGASQSQPQSQSGQGEPTETQDQHSSTNAAARGNTARQRARRGGNFASGGRQFGGQLTRPEATNQTEEGEDGEDSSTVLRPEASTSTSGQPSTGNAQPTIVIESTTPSSSTTKPRRHRGAHKPPATLREAETLTTRIHTEISAGEYECMICYSSVTRKSKIWDCTTCYAICHTGDCGLCRKTVDVFCRCGKTGSPSLCLQGDQGEKPMCRRVCHTTLNCLRHECGERCCSGEQKAKERMAAKKKVNVRGRTEDFEPEHICTRVCGKPLKCGSHDCSALCHRGACGSCLEASFDELACHCGRTRIMPPVPCGTKPPSCRFPCQRSKPCGHPNPTDHLCHLDDEACPNCPYLVQKRCVCGRTVIKNQPCYRDSVSCGQTCGLPLSCGSHICLKTCHAEGGCQEPCTQTCKKSRPLCGHDCQEACHAPFACSVNIPCAAKVTTSCPCGNVKQEVTCNTSMNNQHPKRPEIKCIDDCRRRQLAAAFNVDLEKKAAEEAINAYSDETLQFYIDNKVWCAGIEKMMREFCEDSGKVRLAFKPMKTLFRGFIHGLAEDYGLDSESQDPEPYRSVVVMKNGTWQMPIRVLADAVKVRRQEAALAAASSSVNATANGIQQLRKTTGLPAVNAILLSGLRVGLLTSELEKELASVLRQGTLRFGIRWYGDEEVLLEPLPSSFSTEEVEVELGNVRGLVRRHCVVNRIASSVDLCYVGRDGKVTGKEGQGWNVVSVGKGIKAAAPPGPQTAGSYANLFGVLQQGGSAGSKGLTVKSDVGQRKDKVMSPVLPKEEPVDDWLEAVEAEEKAAASAAVSAAASGGEDNGGELSADEDGKEDVAAASTITVVGTSDGTSTGTIA
ncbi:FKBP12-associated protein [Orbilia oligospora]|nr:FKBP12-associated protein [Orbilia oligospora]